MCFCVYITFSRIRDSFRISKWLWKEKCLISILISIWIRIRNLLYNNEKFIKKIINTNNIEKFQNFNKFQSYFLYFGKLKKKLIIFFYINNKFKMKLLKYK